MSSTATSAAGEVTREPTFGAFLVLLDELERVGAIPQARRLRARARAAIDGRYHDLPGLARSLFVEASWLLEVHRRREARLRKGWVAVVEMDRAEATR